MYAIRSYYEIRTALGEGVFQTDQFGRHRGVLQGPHRRFVAKAVALLVVLGNHQCAGLLQRLAQRGLVPGFQGVEVDDFGA